MSVIKIGWPRCYLIINRREQSKMHILPETGYLRLSQILGNPKAQPPIPAVIPVSKSTWWACVKAGKAPASCKLGPRETAWRVEDIRALIEAQSKWRGQPWTQSLLKKSPRWQA